MDSCVLSDAAPSATFISTSAASRPKLCSNIFRGWKRSRTRRLFGTDWPGPGVPEIEKNLAEFRALPLSGSTKEQILSKTALEIWP